MKEREKISGKKKGRDGGGIPKQFFCSCLLHCPGRERVRWIEESQGNW